MQYGKISEENFKSLDRVLDGSSGILSLTTKCNSNVMWAHYGDYHKGFCMEFEFESLSKQGYISSDGRTEAIKVRYGSSYKEIEDIIGASSDKVDLFLRKSDEWKDEDEYRIISFRSNKKIIEQYLDSILYHCKENKEHQFYDYTSKKITNISHLIQNNYFNDCVSEIEEVIKGIENEGDFNENIRVLIYAIKKELELNGELNCYPSKLTSIVVSHLLEGMDFIENIVAIKSE